MRLSRRRVVAGVAALAARPRLSVAQAVDGFTVITLEAAPVQLLEPPQPQTAAWKFSEPVLRARQGVEARYRFINKLGVEVWLHWFGVRGPDGEMTIDIPADGVTPVDCVFTPPDAGTFWLGPLANASQLRDMGLSAMLVVEAEGDAAYVDQPMALDDWMIGEDAAIEAGFGDLKAAIAEGRLGNWFTLNGEHRPELLLPADKLARFRFLNTANVRTHARAVQGAAALAGGA